MPNSFRPLPRWAALLLLVGLAGCSRAPAPEEPLRAVKVMTVGASAYGSAPEFSGEVRARIESRQSHRRPPHARD